MRVCMLCEKNESIRMESYIGKQNLFNINVSPTGELPTTHKLAVIATTEKKSKEFFKISDSVIVEISNVNEFLKKHNLKIINRLKKDDTLHNLGRLEKTDSRDLNYLISDRLTVTKNTTKITSRYWNDTKWLGDQGVTSECVGYAWSHWIEDGPILHEGLPPVISPTLIYKEAQKVDEWPGENYNGTSVRAGAKYLKSTGKISQYLWAFDLNTLINTVLNVGPVVVGTNWYTSMFFPDRNGLIRVSGKLSGGHAYVINGVDTNRRLFRIKNSWGRRWGINGRGFISFNDMSRLIRERAEICLALENNS